MIRQLAGERGIMRTIVPAILANWVGSSVRVLMKAGKPMLWVTAFLTHSTYVALIIVLVITGMGLPIPEDIPLIFSGYLCNRVHSPINGLTQEKDINGDGVKEAVPRHVPKLRWMIIAGMTGVLLGDSIIFTVGRHGIESRGFVARHLRKVMHSKRREWVERHFARHGNLTVFVGRFMPMARAIVFAMAGLSKMSYFRFLLIDGLAAAISVPLFIFIGWYFAYNINQVFASIDQVKEYLVPPLLLVIAVAVLVYLVRRRRRAERARLENA